MGPQLRCLLCLAIVGCTEPEESPPQQPPPPSGVAFTTDAKAVDFGSADCGNQQTARVFVTNRRTTPLVLDVHSDLRDIEVPPQVTLAASASTNIEVRGFFRTRDLQTGTITLAGEDTLVELPTAISGFKENAQLVFDPPILDFGQVLPNTTKDLTLRVTSDSFTSNRVTLSAASTPRFAVVGSNTGLVGRDSTPTFTIQFIAGDTARDYSGTIPLSELGTGVCAPAVLELQATVVE
jgi:hypothetical protein